MSFWNPRLATRYRSLKVIYIDCPAYLLKPHYELPTITQFPGRTLEKTPEASSDLLKYRQTTLLLSLGIRQAPKYISPLAEKIPRRKASLGMVLHSLMCNCSVHLGLRRHYVVTINTNCKYSGDWVTAICKSYFRVVTVGESPGSNFGMVSKIDLLCGYIIHNIAQ